MDANRKLRVMVLAGGPDRERPVSLKSGAEVAAALRAGGHEVRERDVLPDDLSCLDDFREWGGQVIFPVLHGSWGEGGSLQHILDERGIPYVGTAGPAAQLCMDKHRTKLALQQAGVPTPNWEVLNVGQRRTLKTPVVIKALREGSSIGLFICHQDQEATIARRKLRGRYPKLMAEQFIHGKEITVGVLGQWDATTGQVSYTALPPIHIVPATEYYDYEAKYNRDDTRYLFEWGEPTEVMGELRAIALRTHQVLGCRHMSRVDVMLDEAGRPWVLEVNTIPGFTTHSLLPKAAAEAGVAMTALVDRLVRLALGA